MGGAHRRRYIDILFTGNNGNYVEVVHREDGKVQLNLHRAGSKYEKEATYCFYLTSEQRLDLSRFLADVPNPGIIHLPDELPEGT